MRQAVKALLLSMLAQGVYASDAVVMSGACYEVEIKQQAAATNNAFTICIDNGYVTSRMIFANRKGIPAVCYQSGHTETIGQQGVRIILKEGYCDNSMGFGSDTLECVSVREGMLNCRSPHGELELKHTWDLR